MNKKKNLKTPPLKKRKQKTDQKTHKKLNEYRPQTIHDADFRYDEI